MNAQENGVQSLIIINDLSTNDSNQWLANLRHIIQWLPSESI